MTSVKLLAYAASALLVATSAYAQTQPGQSSGQKSDQPAASGGTSSGSAGTGGSASKKGMNVPQGQSRAQTFGQLDKDKSGSISRAEAEASPALVVIFVEADANGNGEISQAEFVVVPLTQPDGTAAK